MPGRSLMNSKKARLPARRRSCGPVARTVASSMRRVSALVVRSTQALNTPSFEPKWSYTIGLEIPARRASSSIDARVVAAFGEQLDGDVEQLVAARLPAHPGPARCPRRRRGRGSHWHSLPGWLLGVGDVVAATSGQTGGVAETLFDDDVRADPITVYTDGACSGNPGPGGWAWAVAPEGMPRGAGGETTTTNQRMEITAVLEALRALDPDAPAGRRRVRLDVRRQLLPRSLVGALAGQRMEERETPAGGQRRPLEAADRSRRGRRRALPLGEGSLRRLR